MGDLRMDASHPQKPLTMDQAAERLTMCRRTLERLIAAKEFPEPMKLTKRMTRVPVADVVAYLERKDSERRA